MAELNKITTEAKEETGGGSDGEGPAPPKPETPNQTTGEEEEGLVIEQVRTVDQDGNLKVVYPSKTDLPNTDGTLRILW